MEKIVPAKLAGDTGQILNARIEMGLTLLREAYHAAQTVNRDPWEFAVEIGHLYAVGLTTSDLRWLLCQGYAQQATEEVRDGRTERTVQPLTNLSLPAGTCFVLTGVGFQAITGQAEPLCNEECMFSQGVAFLPSSHEQTAPSSPEVVEPPLPALLKLLAIVIKANRAQRLGFDARIALGELQTGGLSEGEVRALLDAGYITGPMANGAHLPCLGESAGSLKEEGFALTDEGWRWLTRAFKDLGHASGWVSSTTFHPQWIACKGGGGELRLGGVVLKRVRHDAAGQISVLEELERSGWVEWMPNPLPPGRGTKRKKVLRDTISRLNRGQKPQRVRFHVQDGGVAWEIIA